MTKRFSISLALTLCVAPSALAQMIINRDTPRTPTAMTMGTATLSGTLVTDETTPQEVRRARVDLTADGQPSRTGFTDANGKFAFTKLPAGRYTVAATKPSFVRAAYGAKRADRPGTPITVTDGQQINNVVLKMARGSVVTGTIRDEMGQPTPGVNVRVLQYRMQNGERVLSATPTANAVLGETTDDRGMYRIFGLAAGEYIVTATPRALGTGDVRQMSAGPVPVTVTYAPVFYPGTTTATSAMAVTVGAGEERAGVDFSLQLVRTARLEGTVVTPSGVPPQSVQLLMVPNTTSISGLPAMISMNGRVAPDAEGKFAYSGVAPGRYTVSARMSGRSLWAMADVTMDGENLSGVMLTMQPGLTISGRIVAEGGALATPPVDLASARISLMPATTGGIMIATAGSGSQVDASGKFTLPDVTPGKYRLNAQLGDASWTLKSAVVAGKDTLDFPLEIGPSDRISDAVLTFSNQTQEVSGTLQDASGRPAPDYTIVVFPADKALWSAARRIKTTRPGTDGKFTIRGLPAGNYRIAALVDIAPGEANDPTLLEQLVPATVPFALGDGDRKTQNIKIAGGF